MKRALMYASVASMIQQFNMNNIHILLDLGYEVDVACNFETGSTISSDKINELKKTLSNLNVQYYQIDVPRKITDIKDIKKAYIQTKRLMDERKYDLVHCHSPIGGVICRIANKNSINYENVRMIYTAHGFHFFKGNNPIKNVLFRSIEKYAAKYTDVLITINQEDYQAAKLFILKDGGRVEYVPGIGIDIEKIVSTVGNREQICKELKIPSDSVLILSVGELNENKNHKVIIEALSELPSNYHYIICGTGKLKDKLIELARTRNIEERVHLLGYRSGIISIMKSCDIFAFPSKREGLSVALMEALASGLPCVASKIRGNVDLIGSNDKIGRLVNPDIVTQWVKEIELFSKKLFLHKDSFIDSKYSERNIMCLMRKIYSESSYEK